MLVFCGQRLLQGDFPIGEGNGSNLVYYLLWTVQAYHLMEGDLFGIVPLYL